MLGMQTRVAPSAQPECNQCINAAVRVTIILSRGDRSKASSRRIVEPNGASTSRNRGDAAPTERLEQTCGCLHIGPIRATAGIDAAKTQRLAHRLPKLLTAGCSDGRACLPGIFAVLPDVGGLRRCRLYPRAPRKQTSISTGMRKHRRANQHR